MKLASNMLMVLLYTQGLLGFAGLTTVVLKDWAYSEPTFVYGVASIDAGRRAERPCRPPLHSDPVAGGSNR